MDLIQIWQKESNLIQNGSKKLNNNNEIDGDEVDRQDLVTSFSLTPRNFLLPSSFFLFFFYRFPLYRDFFKLIAYYSYFFL